jgi:hypothetical protein
MFDYSSQLYDSFITLSVLSSVINPSSFLRPPSLSVCVKVLTSNAE